MTSVLEDTKMYTSIALVEIYDDITIVDTIQDVTFYDIFALSALAWNLQKYDIQNINIYKKHIDNSNVTYIVNSKRYEFYNIDYYYCMLQKDIKSQNGCNVYAYVLNRCNDTELLSAYRNRLKVDDYSSDFPLQHYGMIELTQKPMQISDAYLTLNMDAS
jgi:hypothetical protein